VKLPSDGAMQQQSEESGCDVAHWSPTSMNFTDSHDPTRPKPTILLYCCALIISKYRLQLCKNCCYYNFADWLVRSCIDAISYSDE